MDTDLGLGLPASPRVRGRNRRRPSPPRHAHSAPRLSRKDSPAPDETTRLRLKSELIDFDLIKGSALFHTKPSSHDKKLVKEGFTRALLVPLHAKFWRQKPWVYETATALYALHAVAVGIYLFCPDAIVPLNGFEVAFPLGLLLFLAIGYGRVSSTLQAGDSDPALKILSPAKHPAPLHVPTSVADTATSSTTVGLGSEIAESENSDSTDSEEESGNSSSSSEDEAPTTEAMFEATANAQPSTTPNGFSSMPSMTTPKPPTTPTNPLLPRTTSERDVGGRRVTVCVWDGGFPTKKAMSIAELRNTILAKVKATPPRMIYRKIAMLSAAALSIVPIALRVAIKCQAVDCLAVTEDPLQVIYTIVQFWRSITLRQLLVELQAFPLGASIIAFSCMLSTYYMASIIFSALADAEVTYHRRFLYAKCFTALTSSRRSRLANLPHFRLKNVVNIRAWISLRGGRTWLKRQGRQRAADEIVSTAFLIILVLLVVMGMQAVSDSAGTFTANSIFHIEVAAWCMLSSIFLLRFMMLGSNINKKYQNTSLLLTEQMNVYLRLLTKPHKKEKLLVSNNVLKLASKLLKELNSPNKVSGLTMNPLLYNLTRVVVLSAFSSTASEFFGFKLKLWKLKA